MHRWPLLAQWLPRLLLAAGILGLSAAVANAYVSLETPTWFWDTAIYHDQLRQLSTLFQEGRAEQAATEIAASIRSSDYNTAPILPILPLGLALNTGRHVYITSLVVFYLLPASFCAWLLTQACWPGQRSRLGSLLTAVFIWLFPPFWGPTLRGYPDILGLVPLALAGVLILRNRYLTTASTAQCVSVGVLAWATFLVRRHYAYTIVSLLLITFLFAVGSLRRQDFTWPAAIKRLLRNAALVLLPAAMLLLLFQAELVVRILSTSYGSIYAGYQADWPSKVSSLWQGVGPVSASLAALGLLHALRIRNGAVVFCSVTGALSFVLFCLTQAPGIQHRLPMALWLLPAIGAGIRLLSDGRPRRISALVATGVLSYCSLAFSSSVSSQEWRQRRWPAAATAILPEAYPPQINASYPALSKLVSVLTSHPRYAKGKIAILAASVTLNDSIIAAMSDQIKDRLVRISQVDRRDGLDLNLLDADILVTTSTDSIHLSPEHQRVVTLPAQALFDTTTPIGSAFRLDSELRFPLHDGNTVRIFQRRRPAPYANEAMTAWLKQQLQKYYTNVQIRDHRIELS